MFCQLGGGLIGAEVIVSRASHLALLLGRLVLPHYKLAITTVTGIPMKVKSISNLCICRRWKAILSYLEKLQCIILTVKILDRKFGVLFFNVIV